MRNFLIAVVLGLTGLTFYSAFAYKSKVIEDDITKRVTDDLTASNAQGVGIDVDGRHVTLSGIVYDEAQETAYLKTANDTYGALGPIDGLTYQADGGYVTAQKTDAGITLRGSVPNETVRASLLESAAAATDGAVDDQLVISGPEADWQGETQFGMQQLAALSAGAMTASAAGYVLSGTTDGDAAAVSAPVAEREGWSAFVSSPVVATGLQGQVADLSGQIAERDATIGTLNATLGSKDSEIAALTANTTAVTEERDALDARLTALKDGMTDELVAGESLRAELQATRANLDTATAGLDTATATIAERDQTIAAFNAEKSTLVSRAIDTDSALADTEQKLNGAKATIVALTAASSVKDGTINELTGRVTGLEDELANRQAALGSTDEQVATLRATVAERDASLGDAEARIVALNNELGGQDDTIDVLEAQVADKDTSLATADETIASLNADLGARDETIAGMEANATKLDAEVYTLSATVAARDTTIANLNDRLTDTSSNLQSDNERIAQLATIVQEREASLADSEATVAALTSAGADKDSDIGALNGQLNALRNRVAALTEEGEAKDSDNGALNGQVNALRNRVAALTEEGAAKDTDNGALTGRVGELTAVVATRDATIASLRSQGGTANVAEQCATQASNVMEGARINFGSGNARITQESNALLERLTGIALACVGENLTVEIGGHTDSQGSETANKALSERRAQAVLAFMAERGVPTDGVRAVGFGEGSPIATNNTAAGRAANRRITFEWQAR